MSTPPTTRPRPPPMPTIAEIKPMPVATRSRGNSSRMIPKQSGKMPPPSPWSTRPATTPSSVPDERRDEGARGEDAQRDHEHPALAEHVAEAPEERRRDGRGEQVAGQRPGDAGGRRCAARRRARRARGSASSGPARRPARRATAARACAWGAGGRGSPSSRRT